MEATAYDLKTMLGGERRFLIPTFQRDYEWTEAHQWSLLFDDLINTAARLSRARARAAVIGETVTRAERRIAPHFLGAIVLDQLPSRAGEVDQRAVIDGQQRLTTLQLLLRALTDVLVEVGSPRANGVRRLLFNPVDDPSSAAASKYKLWPRRKDRELWCAAMHEDPTAAPGGHLYGQARRYFAERTRSVIAQRQESQFSPDPGETGIDSSDDIDSVDLDTLVDAALGLFKVVSIDLDDSDDAQVIFEVLNGRQTPLSAADLVKNLLFLRAEVADESELEALHEQYWAPLEVDWWRTQVGRGHAARHRRELLLAAWLSSQTGQEANVGHLYGEVRRYINEEARPVREVLSEIGAYRDAYRIVAEADEPLLSPRMTDAYRRLNLLGITTAYPLLLWLRTRAPEELSAEDQEKALVAIESWVVRRLLTRRNTRGYGKVFLLVLERVKHAFSIGSGIHLELIEALANEVLDWPTDATVIRAFEQDAFYGYHARQRLRMILGAVDRQLSAANPKTETASIDYESLQIEHLMPVEWRRHWPLPAEDPAAAERRDHAVNCIGNLTLLTAVLNPSVSNGPWASKRPEIVRHSRLHINRQLQDEVLWDEESIRGRGRHLAESALLIWPSPERLRSLDIRIPASREGQF